MPKKKNNKVVIVDDTVKKEVPDKKEDEEEETSTFSNGAKIKIATYPSRNIPSSNKRIKLLRFFFVTQFTNSFSVGSFFTL